ncbi:MAG: dockerin type I domain-containing protein [Oscillospiraceae bacterium]|nr:dockerin type I domain-containing protein [Oscillospiraceae bacterium]
MTMCLLLTGTPLIASTKSQSIIAGDVNGNGVIDVGDARLILQYLVGKTKLTGLQVQTAMVNGCKNISVTNARMILQYLVGKIDSLEFPQTEPEPKPGYYPVRDVNAMPEGFDVTLNHVENLGYVPGWEKSEAVIVTALEELEDFGIELPIELIPKYDKAFFEDESVASIMIYPNICKI